VGNLVHKRQGFGKAVRDQDAVVALNDTRLELHPRLQGAREDIGGPLEIVVFRNDDYHRSVR
jgi:hypothetical protein